MGLGSAPYNYCYVVLGSVGATGHETTALKGRGAGNICGIESEGENETYGNIWGIVERLVRGCQHK